jgi:hypothetical protein
LLSEQPYGGGKKESIRHELSNSRLFARRTQLPRNASRRFAPRPHFEILSPSRWISAQEDKPMWQRLLKDNSSVEPSER